MSVEDRAPIEFIVCESVYPDDLHDEDFDYYDSAAPDDYVPLSEERIARLQQMMIEEQTRFQREAWRAVIKQLAKEDEQRKGE